MSDKLIYLASPYSRFKYGTISACDTVTAKAAELMLKGHKIFCPITHSHYIEKSMPARQDGDWWLEQDFAVLRHCDELWVYKMPGWEDSYGVAEEIKFANKNNIEVKYIPYEECVASENTE